MAPRPDALAKAPRADAMRPAPARVRRRVRETADTVTLTVDTGVPASTAAPGQFNMLYVFGVGEIPVSLSGEAGAARTPLHTVRAVGPVSRALAALPRGRALGLRGPFGAGWPMASAESHDVVFVAGGLGLAPLRPAIRHVLRHRARYGRVAVVYGARHPRDRLFRRDLASWARRPGVTMRVTVDHAGPDWDGHVGVVTDLLPGLAFDPAATTAFVCGPEPMMRFVGGALTGAGLSPEAIHVSLERNMKCAIGQCGHCQLGPAFICRDGPVLPLSRVGGLLNRREI